MTPVRRRAGLARWAIIGIGGFVFVLFAAVLWYAYVEVMGLGAGGPPPLIRAELGPIKRAPGDPGGMPVANLDSPAVRVLEEEGEPVRVERVLPRQEVPPIPLDAAEEEAPLLVPAPAETVPLAAPAIAEPAAPPPPATAGAASTGDAPAGGTAATAVAPPPPSEPPAAREPAAAPPAPEPARPTTVPRRVEAPARPAQVRAAPEPPRPEPPPPPRAEPQAPPRQPAAQARAAPAAPARSAPVAGPTYRVQLGAFRNDRAANAAWVQLQQRFGSALDGLRPNVVEAETADGTFYRLQAGPLANRDDAAQACTAVKAAGGDCFIVGPLP